jgi:hypothetical protein
MVLGSSVRFALVLAASVMYALQRSAPVVLVRAKRATTESLPVQMVASATQACQGATFPLTFGASAVHP